MEAVLAIGIFAGVVVPIGFAWYREAKGHRQQAVLAAQEGAKATALAAQLADSTTREQQAAAREKEQRERADDLENAWLAAIAAEPVAGAHARMLEAIAAAKAARAARGDSGGAVSDGGATPLSRRGDSRLLSPGE